MLAGLAASIRWFDQFPRIGVSVWLRRLQGEICCSVALRFGVAASPVVKWSQHYRATGSVARSMMGRTVSPDEPDAAFDASWERSAAGTRGASIGLAGSGMTFRDKPSCDSLVKTAFRLRASISRLMPVGRAQAEPCCSREPKSLATRLAD